MPTVDGLAGRIRVALTRPLWAGLALLAVYAVLSLFNSTDGYLGTDTGAKVITIHEMVEGSTLRPDVGYWAEEWDPEGRFHPLLYTVPNDRGEWVNVTTLPMLVAAHPLYAFGGYRLALFLPMLGSLLSAFAARDIARQIRDDVAGWRAYWVVGLASPMLIYALDLWEHSLGAGLMVAAFALLLRIFRGPSQPVLPLGAGLLLGASASMRTETFAVATAFVGATCLALVVRRRTHAAVISGILCLVGFTAVWYANAALESWLGGNSRVERAEGLARSDILGELPLRAEEALITWWGTAAYAYPGDVALGIAFAGSVGIAWWLTRRSEQRLGFYAVALAAVCFVIPLVSGLGFVPGALVASPVAIAGILGPRWSADRALLVGGALGATALTWIFQYTGGANPQWGGRYLLAPTVVLTAVGAAQLGPAHVLIRRLLVGCAVAVTIFGIAWVQWRTAEIEELFAELATRSEGVIISTNGWFVREGGPAVQERRYLSLGPDTTVASAVTRVVRPAGLASFGVLGGHAADVPGASLRETIDLDVLGLTMPYHIYDITA
ncbi:MAG: hypothetical protein KGZ72_10260 [Roseovarius sp.]|nr:hypothetical protein [Roseovarius sp.]